MTDRVINLRGRGARGESFADVLRRTGQFGVLPTDTDSEAIAKVTSGAESAAEDAALSAATAEAAAGPTYADTATGLAATVSGEAFAVDNGDGTVTVYLNSAGSAVAQRTLATTAALASTGTGKGDALVGSDDGASGSLWTTVKGFISYLRASTGASIIGFIQAGTGAVARFVASKLRERVSPLDFGAAGDADPDDNTAGTDDTAAVQAALDYCATNPGTALCLAGKFYKVQWVRIPHRADFQRFFVLGEGGGFVNPATSSSEAPCLFHSRLPESGDNESDASGVNGSMGVTLVDVSFRGGGYGVGYMHALANHLYTVGCTATGLEDGFLTIAASNISNHNITLRNCTNGFHCAGTADYAWTAGMTSPGWNDGVYFVGGYAGGCDRNIYHTGSESEGILSVKGMVLVAPTIASVECSPAGGGLTMISVYVGDCWFEYPIADGGGNPQASYIKLGGALIPYASARIERCHFAFTRPDAVGGVARRAIRYAVESTWKQVTLKQNHISCGSDSIYLGGVHSDCAGNRIPIAFSTNITPASTSNFNSAGEISFAGTDIDAIGSKYSFFYMIDGSNTFLLQYKSTVLTNYVYTVHGIQYVYSGQFPMHNANWSESAPIMRNRVAPEGIAVNLYAASTGLTAPAGAVTLGAGLNGSISFDAVNRGGEIKLIDNHWNPNFDAKKFYQQTNNGRVLMRGNRRNG